MLCRRFAQGLGPAGRLPILAGRVEQSGGRRLPMRTVRMALMTMAALMPPPPMVIRRTAVVRTGGY